MDVQKIKQRFGIIGNSPLLDRAIDIARQVAYTDLSVLITGESGTGKEVFPKIIHEHSPRKHHTYIAVNCGAIPEGTIDSELFGHEKGSFTGAHEKRKGYFEVADGGTIFLDEVAELPVSTQVRLLRVLETGEFLKVGSSQVQKTNVRVVAATNVNIPEAIKQGRFREDLYYRLNTIPIQVPPLRERREDVVLLFRKFAQDFAEKYRMPPVRLDDSARDMMERYKWQGNIRQLKNITEQISVIEKERNIGVERLRDYLPLHDDSMQLPAVYKSEDKAFASEREILYKILFDMKNDMNDLKKLVRDMMQKGADVGVTFHDENAQIIQRLYNIPHTHTHAPQHDTYVSASGFDVDKAPRDIRIQDTQAIEEEDLSIRNTEIKNIKKALEKHSGKRKHAADELGMSERTLYRKIKEYDIK